MALELLPRQTSKLEPLVAAGFRPIAIPPYESALCMRNGECAVVLAPVSNCGLNILTPASYLVDGNFGAAEARNGELFVWKKPEIPATLARLEELEAFRREWTEIPELPPTR